MNGTYISATSFSVTGDQTENFYVDRRVRADDGAGGVVYSSIESSTYNSTPDTTTVVLYDPVLTAGHNLFDWASSGPLAFPDEHLKGLISRGVFFGEDQTLDYDVDDVLLSVTFSGGSKLILNYNAVNGRLESVDHTATDGVTVLRTETINYTGNNPTSTTWS